MVDYSQVNCVSSLTSWKFDLPLKATQDEPVTQKFWLDIDLQATVSSESIIDFLLFWGGGVYFFQIWLLAFL